MPPKERPNKEKRTLKDTEPEAGTSVQKVIRFTPDKRMSKHPKQSRYIAGTSTDAIVDIFKGNSKGNKTLSFPPNLFHKTFFRVHSISFGTFDNGNPNLDILGFTWDNVLCLLKSAEECWAGTKGSPMNELLLDFTVGDCVVLYIDKSSAYIRDSSHRDYVENTYHRSIKVEYVFNLKTSTALQPTECATNPNFVEKYSKLESWTSRLYDDVTDQIQMAASDDEGDEVLETF